MLRGNTTEIMEKRQEHTSQSRCGSIAKAMAKIKVKTHDWLNYFGIVDMKSNIESLNDWRT